MKKALLAATASLGLLATGCATYQSVSPVDRGDHVTAVHPADGTLFCVISNPVANAYMEALRDSIQARGFEFKVLPPGASIAACPYTATFVTQRQSYWRDFLSSAEIVVYIDGDRAGKANYDALRSAGGLNLSNLVMPEAKIEELVDQLLPGMRPKQSTTGTAGAPAAPLSPATPA